MIELKKLFEKYVINQEERYEEFIKLNKNSDNYKNYHKNIVKDVLRHFSKYFKDPFKNKVVRNKYLDGIMKYIDGFNNSSESMKSKEKNLIDVFNKLV